MHMYYRVKAQSLPCLLVTGMLVLGGTSANATYSVIDDDLYPTSVIEARIKKSAEPFPSVREHYIVPFAKEYSPIDAGSRAALDAMIPKMMGNESIQIIGRPDAIVFSTGKLSSLARNRAVNIRDYLTRKGVSASRITIDTDREPNPQLNGSSYPCDVYITNTDSRVSSTSVVSSITNDSKQDIYQSERYATARNYVASVLPVSSTSVNTPVISPLISQARDTPLIQFISKSVKSGNIDVAVALLLLRGLIEANPNDSQLITSATLAAPPKPPEISVEYRALNKVNDTIKTEARDIYPTTVAVIANVTQTSKESDWEILTTDETLKKTLERWASSENWQIVWKDLPEFKNSVYAKLEQRDFLSACDYVLSKAKTAAREAGFEIFVTAYPNRVLLISKEASK